MACYKDVSHVIFDLDGLILDTERLYTEAIQTLTRKYGKEYTFELKSQCMGTKAEIGAQKIIDALSLPITVKEYFDQIEGLYESLFPGSKFLPGAEKLVHHLHQNKIPIAIASGGSEPYYIMKTQNHTNFFKMFNHVVLASSDPEVAQGKPAPDVFLVCASRFADKPEPKKCLVFEDAPLGVQASVAAGMQVVMVPDERLSDDKKQNATMVLKSLEDFQPELFGLPAYHH